MSTILIVDDRPINREVLIALLKHLGHRLLEAADGAEALHIAKTERPDLIIADILMPTMDGYEFVRQLRSDFAVCAHGRDFLHRPLPRREAIALAQSCGVSSVLTKPTDPEVILHAVTAALGGSTPPGSSPPTVEFEREHLRLLTDKASQIEDDLRRKNNGRLSALIILAFSWIRTGSASGCSRYSDTRAARSWRRYAIVGGVDGDGQRLRHLFTSGMDAETAARFGSPELRAAP